MTDLPRARDRAREFDIVIWGATGFTGALAADYLVRNYVKRSGLRLALAGRSQRKLEAIATEIGASELPVLLGDSFDVASLDGIASRTEVVLSAVGPYAKYGAELVGACVRHGTDYCDLTGETHFVRAMVKTHHDDAKKTGARIVHCCGYDSIPSDLGTLMVQEATKERHGRYASQVKLAAGETSGGASGGTIASMLNILDEVKSNPGLRKIYGDPYSLNPAGIRGPDGSDQKGVRFDRDLDMWTAPFVMAAINTRIVRRSHALMGLPWGEDFRYSEVMSTGRGLKGLARAAVFTSGLAGFAGLAALPPTRSLIEKRLPSPGEGPSRETREKGYFKSRLVALSNGTKVRGLVAGDQDPGYGSTAVMVSEAALCLALEGGELETGGGVLTPATSMGMRLLDRLRQAGMTFEILS